MRRLRTISAFGSYVGCGGAYGLHTPRDGAYCLRAKCMPSFGRVNKFES